MKRMRDNGFISTTKELRVSLTKWVTPENKVETQEEMRSGSSPKNERLQHERKHLRRDHNDDRIREHLSFIMYSLLIMLMVMKVRVICKLRLSFQIPLNYSPSCFLRLQTKQKRRSKDVWMHHNDNLVSEELRFFHSMTLLHPRLERRRVSRRQQEWTVLGKSDTRR